MVGFIVIIIIYVLFLIVGILCLKVEIRKKKVCTEITTAKLVDIYVVHNDKKESISYSPIYFFK